VDAISRDRELKKGKTRDEQWEELLEAILPGLIFRWRGRFAQEGEDILDHIEQVLLRCFVRLGKRKARIVIPRELGWENPGRAWAFLNVSLGRRLSRAATQNARFVAGFELEYLPEPVGSDPEYALLHREVEGRVAAECEKLPPRLRQVADLIVGEGILDEVELGTRIGAKPETARRYRTRVRDVLDRALLGDDGTSPKSSGPTKDGRCPNARARIRRRSRIRE
jgi:DNA-directed RNA polymerase specialized sigma24 family protein